MDAIEEFARIYRRAIGSPNLPLAELVERLDTESYRRALFGPHTQGVFYGRADLWDAWEAKDAESWAAALGVPREEPAERPRVLDEAAALLHEAQSLIAQALDKLR